MITSRYWLASDSTILDDTSRAWQETNDILARWTGILGHDLTFASAETLIGRRESCTILAFAAYRLIDLRANAGLLAFTLVLNNPLTTFTYAFVADCHKLRSDFAAHRLVYVRTGTGWLRGIGNTSRAILHNFADKTSSASNKITRSSFLLHSICCVD